MLYINYTYVLLHTSLYLAFMLCMEVFEWRERISKGNGESHFFLDVLKIRGKKGIIILFFLS